MIDYKSDLNQEQLKAVVEGDGPCLILAGAGSGKTRTITYRVAYLLESGVRPDNILLVTFTNKAAREMKERIGELSDGKINLPWSGTFHHIGYRLLRRYAPLMGYTNNFTVLDTQDSLELIKIALKQEGINRKERRFPSPKVLQSIISYARNAETTIEDVLDLKYPNWLEHSEVIGRIASDYAKRKISANAMDFDDLLVNLYLLLLKSENVRKKYSEQFKYVLVDEYQDTNKIQASIIKLFASHHKNLFVVGDDAQSIYSFRAANIKNILDFEKFYPDAKVFRLEINYRSTPDILNLANDVISNNKNQYEKNLRSYAELSECKSAAKPEINSFANQREEAEFIVSKIIELQDEEMDLRKIAVLFRAAYHSQALEMELAKNNIPYDYRGGIRFFERAHIKDVLAYLRIINNRADVVAWNRVLNLQVGIGAVTAQKIISQITSDLETEEVFGNLKLSAKAKIGWNDFLQVYNKLIKEDEKRPSELIRKIVQSKYIEYLETEFPDYRDRLQDIEQLAVFADSQEDLNKFLAEATLHESYAKNKTKDNINSSDEDKIILSTIHQAKGLEWEAVFVINLASGQFPNDRALRENDGLEEERRLFYVAVTRAMKFLHLTYPLSGGFNSFMQTPSMFLEEISKSLIDDHTFVGGGTVFIDPSDDVDDITYEPMDDDKPRTSFLMDI
jgi:DNA helicase II / ATP-dependent DNA helicase PcrA